MVRERRSTERENSAGYARWRVRSQLGDSERREQVELESLIEEQFVSPNSDSPTW